MLSQHRQVSWILAGAIDNFRVHLDSSKVARVGRREIEKKKKIEIGEWGGSGGRKQLEGYQKPERRIYRSWSPQKVPENCLVFRVKGLRL